MAEKIHIFVKDRMSHPVLTVQPDTPVSDAYELMTSKAIRRLPVVENDKLVGIVTLGDLREARPSSSMSVSIYELNYLISKLTVGEVMSHGPYTVTPDTPVQEAIRLMLDRKVSGLPVVDDRMRVVGIITESDVFKMLIDLWEGTKR
jgi:CBS domain-containing protein